MKPNLFTKSKFSHFVSHSKTAFIGIAIGVIISAGLAIAQPWAKVIVEVPKIVEKPVIVKIPIKLTVEDKRQIKCMAINAYFEGRNQPITGIIAINNVVLNRTKRADQYGSTPCDVINQKVKGTWQFSWKGENVGSPKDIDAYAEMYYIAQNVYLGNISDVTGGAVNYHADYVNPGWKMTRTAMIGQHIFYRKSSQGI